MYREPKGLLYWGSVLVAVGVVDGAETDQERQGRVGGRHFGARGSSFGHAVVGAVSLRGLTDGSQWVLGCGEGM